MANNIEKPLKYMRASRQNDCMESKESDLICKMAMKIILGNMDS